MKLTKLIRVKFHLMSWSPTVDQISTRLSTKWNRMLVSITGNTRVNSTTSSPKAAVKKVYTELLTVILITN